MAKLRFEALKKLNERHKIHVDVPSPHISQFFGENVFGIEQMRGTLAPAVFKKVSNAIKNHEKIDETTADAVASAAKSWANTPLPWARSRGLCLTWTILFRVRAIRCSTSNTIVFSPTLSCSLSLVRLCRCCLG